MQSRAQARAIQETADNALAAGNALLALTPAGLVVKKLGFAVYAFTGTAGLLSTFGVSVPKGAKSFVGTLTGATVNARGDGIAPTAAVSGGQLINVATIVALTEDDLSNMQFIAISGSPVLAGHFYNQPVSVVA